MFFKDDAQRQVFCKLLFAELPTKESPIGDDGSAAVLRTFIQDVWGGVGNLTIHDFLTRTSDDQRTFLLGAIVALHQGPVGVESWIQNEQHARARKPQAAPVPAAPNGPVPSPIQPDVPLTPIVPQVPR